MTSHKMTRAGSANSKDHYSHVYIYIYNSIYTHIPLSSSSRSLQNNGLNLPCCPGFCRTMDLKYVLFWNVCLEIKRLRDVIGHGYPLVI